LHLYHIQFSETLMAIEQDILFNDVLAMSQAIQTRALEFSGQADGDLKSAADLLTGYATAPIILLGRTAPVPGAAKALKELTTMPDDPAQLDRRMNEFKATHAELLRAAENFFFDGSEGVVTMQGWIDESGEMRTAYPWTRTTAQGALKRYIEAHPGEAEGDPTPPAVRDAVRAELARIAAHAGVAASPLFAYDLDYSQFVPRGHYTRSKRLEQYFQAMMWFGQTSFLLNGSDSPPNPNDLGPRPLISTKQARIQTLAACMLAGMMDKKMPDGRAIGTAWNRIHAISAFFVGLSDDLMPQEYRQAIGEVLGKSVDGGELAKPENLAKIRERLTGLRQPRILAVAGTQPVGLPVDQAAGKDLSEMLRFCQGFRLMGQSYVPDSEVLSRTVYPTVGAFTGHAGGESAPFTLVQTQGGPARCFPRGLDLMTTLGSGRASYWLKTLGDDRYDRFDETLAKLKGELDKAAAADAHGHSGWYRNLYWSWLRTLEPLLDGPREGYPTFMRTEAWQDKQLSAALASWSQLRHDTILYVKQSRTWGVGGARFGPEPPKPKLVEGYVEPVPELYARLLALTRMTRRGLESFGVLNEPAAGRFANLDRILTRLLEITKQELTNQQLAEADYTFIRSFGSELNGVVAGAAERGMETTLAADVHSDNNSQQALEEATGFLRTMVVVYPMPDGGIVAGVGPVLSHYEFKVPFAGRLTDEEWKKLLNSGHAPVLPEWTATFNVSVTGAK